MVCSLSMCRKRADYRLAIQPVCSLSMCRKRADYRLAIQPVCSLRLYTPFYLWQFIHSKLNIKRKISTDNRVFCNPCSIFMRIRCRVHTVYRIIFLPISTPMKILRCSCICSICFQYQRRYFCCLH